MFPAAAWRAATLAGAAALLLSTAGAMAQDAPAADDGRPPGAARPSLPEPSSRIGRLKRDAHGKIVPAGPALPADDDTPARLVGPDGSSDPGRIGAPPPPAWPSITSFDPGVLDSMRSRAEHETQARRVQGEIDRIVLEEREARARGAAVNGRGRTEREESLIRQLERADSEVREHEMQHYHAGQPYTRHPEFFEVIGPDGRRFAVSGITAMDAAPVNGDMEATVRKLEQLLRAALAPREPSEEDRRVAAALEQLIGLARPR